MRRRIKKNGAYGSNLRVVDAVYNANRIEEVTVASDKKNSYTKLVNADQAGEAEIQENVFATFTENGTYEVEPWPTKDAIEKATVTVAIPLEANKATTIDASTYTEPVEVTPSSGKTAMNKNTVTLTNIPVLPEVEANKEATIDVSSYVAPVEIEPTDGKDVMEKATVTLTNVPVISQNTTATIDVSTYTEPVEVTPDLGYDATEKATITLSNVPVPDVVQINKDATVDVSTYDPANKPVITPDSGYDTMAQSTITLTNVPATQPTRTYILDLKNPSSGSTWNVDPETGYSAMSRVAVRLNSTYRYVRLYRWIDSSTSNVIFTHGLPDSSFDLDPVKIYKANTNGDFISYSSGAVYHDSNVDANRYITYDGADYYKGPIGDFIELDSFNSDFEH